MSSALAVLVGATTSAAADSVYVEARAAVVGGGSVNLGAQTGQRVDNGNDLAPAQLGSIIGGGVVLDRLELGAEVGIGVGGLQLDRIETVYLGVPPESVGGSVWLGAAAVARYQLGHHPKLRFPLSLRAGWQAHGASSPAGGASITSMFVELGAGIARRVRRGGRVELLASIAPARVLSVRVGTGGEPFESATDPSLFVRFGISFGYVQRF